jgi:FMN phosphatase YigB (HAD superfamily)
MEKLILTDCDGVLLYWNNSIRPFMALKGFEENEMHKDDYHLSLRYRVSPELEWALVKEFNESKWVETIEPYADAVEYVGKLANKGFRFIAVTSLSDHPVAVESRKKNLQNLFGDVFDEVICLSQGKNKYEQLLRWKDSGLFWIEDHAGQAEAGLRAGLRSVLIDHPYNAYHSTDHFTKVSHINPWEQIHDIVCKEYKI